MDIRILEVKDIADAARLIAATGATPSAAVVMAQKAVFRVIRLCRIDNRAVNLIKQEALSLGAEAAVSHHVSRFTKGFSDVVVMATERQLLSLIQKLSMQPFGLELTSRHLAEALLNYQRKKFIIRCGRTKVTLGKKPAVMGILNVTPDSFSDGGFFDTTERAVERGLEIASEGADFIDVGGESTRPGSSGVSAAEEKRRVLPVIQKLTRQLKIPVSIDTSKPDVALAALECGATIINDVSALRVGQGRMAAVAAKWRVPIILMHMQGLPRTMQKKPAYEDVIGEISDFFTEKIEFALKKGIRAEQVIIDPGIGFGKTVQHNLEILKNLREFKVLGYPVAIGTSRKSFIGKILKLDHPRDRMGGSIATCVWACAHGAHLVRVHDVKETVQAMKLLEELT